MDRTASLHTLTLFSPSQILARSARSVSRRLLSGVAPTWSRMTKKSSVLSRPVLDDLARGLRGVSGRTSRRVVAGRDRELELRGRLCVGAQTAEATDELGGAKSGTRQVWRHAAPHPQLFAVSLLSAAVQKPAQGFARPSSLPLAAPPASRSASHAQLAIRTCRLPISLSAPLLSLAALTSPCRSGTAPD
jgi:hypothetical protein